MKTCKVLSCLMVLVLMLSMVLPMEAGAIDLIDFDKYEDKGAFTVTSKYGDTPMTGMKIRIYLVATPDANCNLTPVGPLDIGGADLNHLDQQGWENLASVLAAQVKFKDPSQPDSDTNRDDPVAAQIGTIGQNGQCTFSGLKLGLYLVAAEPLHDEKTQITYQYPPALVMVPTRNQDPSQGSVDHWHYQDIHVSGKVVTAKTDVKVIKEWDDKNNSAHKRPLTLKVQLYNGETAYGEPVYLTNENKWTYEWPNLPVGDWKVKEDTTGLDKLNYKPGEPYRDDMGTKFIVWHIKNTYSPPSPKLPQTGQLWWPVPVLLSAGLVFILVGVIRRRGEKDEA